MNTNEQVLMKLATPEFEAKNLAEICVKSLIEFKRTVALAESCTGGYATHLLTQVPGVSGVLPGAIVPYRRDTIVQELGVMEDLIHHHGAVSEVVARVMAESVKARFKTDFGVSTTGYLGPTGGDAHAGTGTFCVAVAGPKGTVSGRFQFDHLREANKMRATQLALDLLRVEILRLQKEKRIT